VATGRSYVGMTSSFTSLFKLYARSLLCCAGEMTALLVAHAFDSHLDKNFPSTELGTRVGGSGSSVGFA